MAFAKEVLMVEPVHFLSNPETAEDNFFQHSGSMDAGGLKKAMQEFQGLKNLLLSKGIRVFSYSPLDAVETPDEVYPNNWFSTHPGGEMILYPMKAVNRRQERRSGIINELQKNYAPLFDMTKHEEEGKFLEGTGSLVLDEANKVAYAAVSQRTDTDLVRLWCERMNYSPVTFHSRDRNGAGIYHTNVLMCIGEGFAILCEEAIPDAAERVRVKTSLSENGRFLVNITTGQMHDFCGNCLQLKNKDGELFLVMSTKAFNSFSETQIEQLSSFSAVLHTDLDTIETMGGGGARCMLAELF